MLKAQRIAQLDGADFLEEIRTSSSACYAQQCSMTTLATVKALGLTDDMWSMSFQSRLGPTRWLQPATSDKVQELAAKGIERLVIVSPAFVADGLETLEELEEDTGRSS